jgi:dihydroneopterin aldolase
MEHYAYVLSVSRLALHVHIGFYEKERNELQLIEISFRLYFTQPPEGVNDTSVAFFDYGKLANVVRDFIADKKFNLIEAMGLAIFQHLRGAVDAMGGQDAKLWLELNKIHAPVPDLRGGASFIHSDLPAGATYIPSVAP